MLYELSCYGYRHSYRTVPEIAYNICRFLYKAHTKFKTNQFIRSRNFSDEIFLSYSKLGTMVKLISVSTQNTFSSINIVLIGSRFLSNEDYAAINWRYALLGSYIVSTTTCLSWHYIFYDGYSSYVPQFFAVKTSIDLNLLRTTCHC